MYCSILDLLSSAMLALKDINCVPPSVSSEMLTQTVQRHGIKEIPLILKYPGLRELTPSQDTVVMSYWMPPGSTKVPALCDVPHTPYDRFPIAPISGQSFVVEYVMIDMKGLATVVDILQQQTGILYFMTSIEILTA